MAFEDILRAHARRHPSLGPRDVLKLCYQAAYGPEHLLSDIARARAYFDAEYEAVKPRCGELAEPVSAAFARVDLGVWKFRGFEAETLFGLFSASAAGPLPQGDSLEELLSSVDNMAAHGALPFAQEDWTACVQGWRALGGGPVHHSDVYRAGEQPAYRMVRRDLLSPRDME